MAYEDNVFVNCPFDSDFEPLFYAILFTIHDCGFVARCGLEVDDAGEAGKQKQKRCLILDTERYRFQAFCSDIAGQDSKNRSGA